MPHVNVRINRGATPKVASSFLAALTNAVHEEKGDAVAMICVTLQADEVLSFGDDAEAPCAVVDMTATAFDADITARLTRRFTAVLGDAFGIPAERMYVFFREVPPELRHMVGWNGKTFLELRPNIHAV